MIRERKHIRLKNYDYTSAGMYFITICTKNREYFFGNIESVGTFVGTSHVMSQQMSLSEIGKITNQYFQEIPIHFSNAILDEFIVMPNHVHGIIILDGNTGTRNEMSLPDADDLRLSVGTSHVMSLHTPTQLTPTQLTPIQPIYNQFGNPIPGSISVIIQQFKSSVKRWCNKNRYENFKWQSRFHEHIIRNEYSYLKIKNYIINNISSWNDDMLKKEKVI